MPGLRFTLKELILCFLISLIGLANNSVVFFVNSKQSPKLRAASFNRYQNALAVVDLLVSVTVTHFFAILLGKIPHCQKYAGIIMCKISHGLPFWLAGISMYLLVEISIERYILSAKTKELFISVSPIR